MFILRDTPKVWNKSGHGTRCIRCLSSSPLDRNNKLFYVFRAIFKRRSLTLFQPLSLSREVRGKGNKRRERGRERERKKSTWPNTITIHVPNCCYQAHARDTRPGDNSGCSFQCWPLCSWQSGSRRISTPPQPLPPVSIIPFSRR